MSLLLALIAVLAVAGLCAATVGVLILFGGGWALLFCGLAMIASAVVLARGS